MEPEKAKRIVKENYAKIAEQSGCCSCCGTSKAEARKISKSIGYSKQEMDLVPEANLGLGCGNPTAFGIIKKGMTVLDLGSGAGFDCFIAAQKVGPKGKVIGLDMTPEMIAVARNNANKYKYKNIEFILGDIEEMPLKSSSVDLIISNCVINLAPDKSKVFSEAFRVLKSGGQLLVSDIVLLKELTKKQRQNEELLAGCVGGAILKDEYIQIVKKAGFEVKIKSEDKQISKRQYQGIPLESLKLAARKK